MIASDLSESSAPQALYDQTKAKALVVSYLVNNAGFGNSGAFSGMDPNGQLHICTVIDLQSRTGPPKSVVISSY